MIAGRFTFLSAAANAWFYSSGNLLKLIYFMLGKGLPKHAYLKKYPQKINLNIHRPNNVLNWICTVYGVRYFPKGIFPRATFQVIIFQVATSQMCNFPNNNFLNVHFPKWQFRKSGNFPMKEKRHFPHKGSMKWTVKFYIFENEFLNFLLRKYVTQKISIQFLSVSIRQEHVGGLHPFFKE